MIFSVLCFVLLSDRKLQIQACELRIKEGQISLYLCKQLQLYAYIKQTPKIIQ